MLTVLVGATALASASPNILASNSIVIGTVSGTRWAEPAAEMSAKGKRSGYTVTIGRARPGVSADIIEPAGGLSGTVLRGGQAKYPGVVWLGPAPKFPRPVRVQTADRTLYTREVHRALNNPAVPLAQVEVTKLYRVDLDGDKTDEVLIEAQTKGLKLMGGSYESKPGMFSGVWIRAVRRGEAAMIALQADVATAESRYFENRLAAVADFDADGQYEIVVSSLGFESESGHVYQMRNAILRMLSQGGLGA